jgi:hypothetical protein
MSTAGATCTTRLSCLQHETTSGDVNCPAETSACGHDGTRDHASLSRTMRSASSPTPLRMPFLLVQAATGSASRDLPYLPAGLGGAPTSNGGCHAVVPRTSPSIPTVKAQPIPARLRKRILDRDDHSCVRCGNRIRDHDYSLHHRLPRSRGGRHAPENLVTLCGSATSGCHAHVESFRATATIQGWLVPTGEDPAAWPILRDGVWTQPTTDGWIPVQRKP